MVAQFTDAWLEKVKAASDIVDVVGSRMELKRTGKNYSGLCPFHSEKTPSFSVNPEKQFFYCFGCGEGGSVFDFLMKTDGLSFREAAQSLAERAGIEVPQRSPEQVRQEEARERLYLINHRAAEFFYRALRSSAGNDARRYLSGRSIDKVLARQFYVGYAPPGWDSLTQFLLEQGFAENELVESGLVISRSRGVYDRFRDRIIFPICDHQGRFLAFGGRSLGEGQPKYLNSPEQILFRKSSVLYGLNWTKESIRRRDNVVIVEGYTDCVSLWAKGITHTAATLGTALTEQHAQLLRRFSSKVTLAFDGDEAGLKAIVRGMSVLRDAGLKVSVASLPSGTDPDAFARQQEPEVLERWLETAVPWPEYLIRLAVTRHDLSHREGKLTATKEIIEIVASLSQAVEREEYVRFAAEQVGVDLAALKSDLLTYEGESNPKKSRVQNLQNHPERDSDAYLSIPPPDYSYADQGTGIEEHPGIVVERDILRLTLDDAGRIDQLHRDGIRLQDFLDPEYRHLLALLLEGTWDRHGEQVAATVFAGPKPGGKWSEYIYRLRARNFSVELSKIEEKVMALEKNMEGTSVRENLFPLLYRYFLIRKKVFSLLRRIKNEGPLGRGESNGQT